MEIVYAIVHELKKEANGAPDLFLRDSVLPISDSLKRLSEELLVTYGRRSSKGFGSFDKDENTYPFSKDFSAFLTDNTQECFIDFTKKGMGHLKSRIADANLATGGYVLFFLYANNDEPKWPYLFMTLLRQTTGCAITRDLNVGDIDHLDLRGLHIGCHINTAEWKKEAVSPYITFIKGAASKTTPEYFLRAIGCAEFTDSRAQTEELLRALSDYAQSQGLNAEQKRLMNQRVHDHCREQGVVDVQTLSAVMDAENPERFFEFVNKGEYKVSHGFEPDKRILKKLREISAKGEGIKLTFPATMLGERISFSKSDGTPKIIIKNPPESMIKAFQEDKES